MPSREDIRWFKEQFQDEIAQAIVGTPLTVDHITALACQETGSIWPFLRKAGLSVPCFEKAYEMAKSMGKRSFRAAMR